MYCFPARHQPRLLPQLTPARLHPCTRSSISAPQGSGVTATIRSGITNVAYFQDAPDVLAYGMLCAMLATGI